METDKNLQQEWYNDAKNWKAGFIYTNPKDKRILVPKKLGIGWTFNFANPVAIVLAAIIVGVPIIILIIGAFSK